MHSTLREYGDSFAKISNKFAATICLGALSTTRVPRFHFDGLSFEPPFATVTSILRRKCLDVGSTVRLPLRKKGQIAPSSWETAFSHMVAALQVGYHDLVVARKRIALAHVFGSNEDPQLGSVVAFRRAEVLFTTPSLFRSQAHALRIRHISQINSITIDIRKQKRSGTRPWKPSAAERRTQRHSTAFPRAMGACGSRFCKGRRFRE
ncbi:hypothetical protein BDR07DRAFT_1479785 [Suillus spraguei]|nr:hypothetical protein BDR07DRAFT_1479785 [Suillus spraguei]